MKPDAWTTLLNYWKSKHSNGRPPGRRDIDPLIDVPAVVANLLLADIVEGGYRYRLVGSGIIERFGQDLTGQMAGTSRFIAPQKDRGIANYDHVRDTGEPLLVVSRNGEHPDGTTIILPLAGSDGTTETLLVGVFFEGQYHPTQQLQDLTVIYSPG